jgi:hypothetical protein
MKEQEKIVEDRYGITGRRHLGTDYDPETIDAAHFSGVIRKPPGYFDERPEGPEGPPEGHVESSPHARSILENMKILKPIETIEVGDKRIIVDGQDRWFLSLKYGIPCPIEIVEGLPLERAREYILEINLARRSQSIEERKAQVRRYLEDEEVRLKAGAIERRSAYNKVAVICGVAHSTVRRIEFDDFRETRWADACKGEDRESVNGKAFKVKEGDPEIKLEKLLSKLRKGTPGERAATIGLIRKLTTQYKDVLGQSRISMIEADLKEAESRATESPVPAPPQEPANRGGAGSGGRPAPLREPDRDGIPAPDGDAPPPVDNPLVDRPAKDGQPDLAESCIDDSEYFNKTGELEHRPYRFSDVMAELINSDERMRRAAEESGWAEILAGRTAEQDRALREHYHREDTLFARIGFDDDDLFRIRRGLVDLVTERLAESERPDPLATVEVDSATVA